MRLTFEVLDDQLVLKTIDRGVATAEAAFSLGSDSTKILNAMKRGRPFGSRNKKTIRKRRRNK